MAVAAVDGGGAEQSACCVSVSPMPGTPRNPHAALPPAAPSGAVPEAAPFAAAIDGSDGKSWHLPLEPLSSTSLEVHSPGEQPELDRLQVGGGSGGRGGGGRA